MSTTSEFLRRYGTKKSTRQTYTFALRTSLRITLGTAPAKALLDEAWHTYLHSGRNIWHDLEEFPDKGKEHHLTPKTINLYLQIVLLYLGECGIIAVSSGIRIGELLRLTFDDIDLTTTPAEIHIPAHITKTETPRTAFISTEAAGVLREWLSVRTLPHTLRRTPKRPPTPVSSPTPLHMNPNDSGSFSKHQGITR